MRYTMNYLGFFLGLSLAVATFSGCIMEPRNGDELAAVSSTFNFQGEAGAESAVACLYAAPSETGSYSLVGEATAESGAGTTIWGVTGWSYADNGIDIPQSNWGCDTSTTGVAEVFLKGQQRTSGGACTSSFGGSGQGTIAYTYDDTANLAGCYSDNTDWAGFLADCKSPDAPIIRMTAEAVGDPFGTLDCRDACAVGGVARSNCQSTHYVQTHPGDIFGSGICQNGTIGSPGNYGCFVSCSNNLIHENGDGTCPAGSTKVGQNPGVLCNGTTELDCAPNQSPQEL